MEADQRDTWKSAAHRFKGSSGNLGAMALHQLCKRAESRFEDAPAHKQDMLADMKQQTARVAEFFASIAA
jgi:HPt (histidine-containing phosphotransfer) domain-containing protein